MENTLPCTNNCLMYGSSCVWECSSQGSYPGRTGTMASLVGGELVTRSDPELPSKSILGNSPIRT
jgi:hypothetical protein